MNLKRLLVTLLLALTPLLSIAATYYVATSDVDVRTGAGNDYPISFTLHKGDEVEVLSKDGRWYQIDYSGETGYAKSGFFEPVSESNRDKVRELYEGSMLTAVLVTLGVVFFIWLLPILIIATSGKTTSGEKIVWILAVLFISWFAWIFYWLLAPIKKKEPY